MAEEYRREPEAVRDPETGRVTGYVERNDDRPVVVKKKGGGLLMGLLLGALLVAGGAAIYASNQGGFEQAGAQVDTELAEAEDTTRVAANDAGEAIGNAAEQTGDAAEQAGDDIQNTMN